MRHALAAIALAALAADATAQAIPMRPGLVLTYVHRNFDHNQDSEFKVWILRMTESETVFTSEFTHLMGSGRPRFEEHMSRRELLGARNVDYGRSGHPATMAEHRPHTLFMLSQRLLKRLKHGEVIDLIIPFALAPGNDVLVQGTLRAVPPTPATLEVLIDGEPRRLATVQAEGVFERLTGGIRSSHRFWFLDDSVSAWVLKDEGTLLADGKRFHMVLGSALTSASAAARVMALELERNCRARAYGFYFAFNRAQLDSLSAPTFAEVAAMLREHPQWTVTIEGHTDSVGNPEANRRLSERRAAAVRETLISTYGIAGARLTTAGVGALRPVATNGTLEGRARNRRVDLVRRCGDQSP